MGALTLLLGSCAHAPTEFPKPDSAAEYQIGREDVLEVAVWRDPDLSRVVPVRPDGRISLPLVGELEASGRTPAAMAQLIAQRLRPYVEDPRVVVIVREVNAPRFFVIGEVARPGAFPLRGSISVLQALSMAGGPNEFADRSSIVVVRGDRRWEVDYASLVSKEESDFALAPGDTIYVP
jgi:polysaccharide export outer membrane protein